MSRVGFTTTIPIEILFAAGKILVSLNNVFISHPQKKALVEKTELEGFPRNICGWIKGIYAVAMRLDLDEVIAVTQGDCSNTQGVIFQTGLRDFTLVDLGGQDTKVAHVEGGRSGISL